MRFMAAVTEENELFVAQCLEVNVASQGMTVQEALSSLREALELYFEDQPVPSPLPSPIIAPVEVAV